MDIFPEKKVEAWHNGRSESSGWLTNVLVNSTKHIENSALPADGRYFPTETVAVLLEATAKRVKDCVDKSSCRPTSNYTEGHISQGRIPSLDFNLNRKRATCQPVKPLSYAMSTAQSVCSLHPFIVISNFK